MLRNIDKRLRHIEHIIQNSRVIDTKNLPLSSKVRFGNTVYLDDGSHYTILGTHEVDLENNIISNCCPLGKELIGKTVGDYVSVKDAYIEKIS
jgi:transcription elongation factor GreA